MNLSELWEMMEGRGEWHALVHGVAKRWTQLRDYTATTMCSSVLACLAIPSPPPSQTQGAVGKWGFISLPLGRNSYSSDASNLINFSVFFFLLNRLWNLKPEYMSLRKGAFFLSFNLY